MIISGLMKLSDHMIQTGQRSCRKLSKIFNTSKSSVHRKKIKIKSRKDVIGSEFFESEAGQLWLIRLVIACIFVFGNTASVGSERISLFFSLISISAFSGLSRSSVAKLEDQVDDLILIFKKHYDDQIKDKAHDLKIMPGGDETFFKNMLLLVCMDLKSSFIFIEEPVTNRDHATWEKYSLPWLSKFKWLKCFLSDKAKALLKLAETSLDAIRIPDLFHMMNDTSTVMKYSFARMAKSTKKSMSQVKQLIEKGVDAAKNKALLAKLSLEINAILRDQTIYQKNLRKLSTSLHPFGILSTNKQTSHEVESKMQSSLDIIKKIKEQHNIKDSSKKLDRVSRQIPDSAKLIDQWWDWVNASLEPSDVSPEMKSWLTEYLLPFIYWQRQIKKTRSKKIKRFYKLSASFARKKLLLHYMTVHLFANKSEKTLWTQWAHSMVNLFVRSTSAIEGRNSWLSQIYFNGRGLSKKRILSQTAIRNYYIKRSDGTTACERLSKIKPEDLFEFIVGNFQSFPQPRRRKHQKSSDPPILAAVPA